MKTDQKLVEARTAADADGVRSKEQAMRHLVFHMFELVDEGASLGDILVHYFREMGMPPVTCNTIAAMVDAGIDEYVDDQEQEAVSVF